MNDSTPVTGLLDSEASGGHWRAAVYGLVNPVVAAQYNTIQLGSNWYYSKAFNAGDNSTTQFFGPYPDSVTANTMMNSAKTRDGF